MGSYSLTMRYLEEMLRLIDAEVTRLSHLLKADQVPTLHSHQPILSANQ